MHQKFVTLQQNGRKVHLLNGHLTQKSVPHTSRCPHTHAHTYLREEGASIEFKLRIKCEPRERPFILGGRSWVALFQEIDKSKFIIGRARGRPCTVLTFLSSSIEQPKFILTTANRSSTKNKPQLSDEKLLKNCSNWNGKHAEATRQHKEN